MANKKTKKNARQKRTLVLALLIAATIAAGSTFAWFTSKDEVTNRLSANASYNVAIGETFQPPENWAPGQTVDKDTYAVNTGNVGALSRMWVNGSLRVMNHTDDGGIPYNNDTGGFDTSELSDVVNSNLLAAGFTKMDASGNYYRTLDTAQSANGYQTTNQQGFPDVKGVALSEVQAMQSGILAYAPNGAEYTYVTNQPTTLKIYAKRDGDASASYQEVLVPAGVLVHVGASSAADGAATIGADGVITYGAQEKAKTLLGEDGTTEYDTVYVEAQTVNATTPFQPVPVEYETFTPLDNGLYLFLRNEVLDDDTDRAPEFSGYYVTGTATPSVTYYALESDKGNNRSEFTVPSGAVTVTYAGNEEANDFTVAPTNGLKLYSANYTEFDADKMKYFTNDDGSVVYILYDLNGNGKFDPATDIYVEVNMNTANWAPIGFGDAATTTDIDGVTKDASKLTYYYKGVVEPGETSEKCVDSVKLGELTTGEAFLAMDFDLNVLLESIQITTDETGKETLPTANWVATEEGDPATPINTGAKASTTDTDDKITSIDWTKIS